MGAPRPEPPPRPRRDPRAETQQGPYATAPPRGQEKAGLRAAAGQIPERRPRGPPAPPSAQSGRASSAATAPFLLLCAAEASGSREAARARARARREELTEGRGRGPRGRAGAGSRRRGRAAAGGRRAGTGAEAPPPAHPSCCCWELGPGPLSRKRQAGSASRGAVPTPRPPDQPTTRAGFHLESLGAVPPGFGARARPHAGLPTGLAGVSMSCLDRTPKIWGGFLHPKSCLWKRLMLNPTSLNVQCRLSAKRGSRRFGGEAFR